MLTLRVLALLRLASLVAASFTADLTIKQCDAQGCHPTRKRVALDAPSNGTEQLISVGGTAKDALTLKYGGVLLPQPAYKCSPVDSACSSAPCTLSVVNTCATLPVQLFSALAGCPLLCIESISLCTDNQRHLCVLSTDASTQPAFALIISPPRCCGWGPSRLFD